jgi:hypothetical protein
MAVVPTTAYSVEVLVEADFLFPLPTYHPVQIIQYQPYPVVSYRTSLTPAHTAYPACDCIGELAAICGIPLGWLPYGVYDC